MPCTNRSDVAIQYLNQLRRNDIAGSRVTLAQYGAALGAGFTKEMLLLDLRNHFFGRFPQAVSLMSVSLSEPAFQTWALVQADFLAQTNSLPTPLTIGPGTEWCVTGAPAGSKPVQSSYGPVVFVAAAGLLAAVYLRVIFASN